MKIFALLFRLINPLLNLRTLPVNLPGYFRYTGDLIRYSKIAGDARIKLTDLYPCLGDNTRNQGFDRHYIYHPAWAARIVSRNKPAVHIDISSILHFSTILSAFVHVQYYDFRPAKLNLDNLTTGFADLTQLQFEPDSVSSLSCMHTIEHIGLGRYGDPLNPEGDKIAIQELKRVMKPGGNLLLVVPVGKAKIMFNAHRIYNYQHIIDLFDSFELREFSLVPDDPGLGMILNASREQADQQEYGCGCFWFSKK
jgi:hypothetical protein